MAIPPGSAAAASQAVDVFAAGISARRAEHSQVLLVSFDARRPEVAALGANTVAALFVEQAARLRADSVRDATSWLAMEIGEQRKRVEETQRALQQLAEQTGTLSFEDRRMLLEQRLKQLGTGLNERAGAPPPGGQPGPPDAGTRGTCRTWPRCATATCSGSCAWSWSAWSSARPRCWAAATSSSTRTC